ncbi:hypothetical protein ACHAWO_007294 [Cyclotella atomus]|jgi:hypothetical protein|uniref:Thioredoxin-like fold domain-containing protein n=1 Tax=Cyclotella atomus TaxID=382360 RepID=A0ABD3MX05_9STRA
MSQRKQQQLCRLPGVLAALPESLPFHPFSDDYRRRKYKIYFRYRRRSRGANESDQYINAEAGSQNEAQFIPDAPIYNSFTSLNGRDSFTLFFFVDCTNRQSLLAISIVSKWFHHALNEKDATQDERHCSDSRIICVPNQSTQSHIGSILSNTGFYELPFNHPSRLTLLFLLNTKRVPSIVVVKNSNGKVITPWGWEAIEREGSEGGSLDQWIERNAFETKKGFDDTDGESKSSMFDSNVVTEWGEGRSGLPCWWHLLSCLF